LLTSNVRFDDRGMPLYYKQGMIEWIISINCLPLGASQNSIANGSGFAQNEKIVSRVFDGLELIEKHEYEENCNNGEGFHYCNG
jgi:hypothetical protein